MEVTCVFSFMFFDLFILVVLICDKDKKKQKNDDTKYGNKNDKNNPNKGIAKTNGLIDRSCLLLL